MIVFNFGFSIIKENCGFMSQRRIVYFLHCCFVKIGKGTTVNWSCNSSIVRSLKTISIELLGKDCFGNFFMLLKLSFGVCTVQTAENLN